jgi:hypothetical protein
MAGERHGMCELALRVTNFADRNKSREIVDSETTCCAVVLGGSPSDFSSVICNIP